jgi:eukaryotic-like serine/threonine-protein kinase
MQTLLMTKRAVLSGRFSRSSGQVEQARGQVKEVGPAADVYALGAMLYEFLAGRPPFKADTAWDTLSQVINDEPVPPRVLQPGVPRDLETICLKCLEKDPIARYASAERLADDLGCFLRGEDVSARPVALPGRIVRWARRRPALAATFTALLLFYALHLGMRLSGLGPEDEGFHWFATGAVVVWAAGASVFQWLTLKARFRTPATYAWAALDVALLTALLVRGGGSKSSFLPAYLLLIAAAGLRFRVGLVWFVTGLCVVSYAVVDVLTRWHRPESAGPLPGSIFFLVSLVLLGLCFHLVLGRVREPSLHLDR